MENEVLSHAFERKLEVIEKIKPLLEELIDIKEEINDNGGDSPDTAEHVKIKALHWADSVIITITSLSPIDYII